MDDKRFSTTARSVLPRPTSRLPQPRASAIPTPAATSRLRPAASVEALRGRTVQPATAPDLKAASDPKSTNPRLRTTPSRDQLRKPRPAPPVSLQTGPRGLRNRSVSREREENTTAGELQLKRPLAPWPRPSGQLARDAVQPELALGEESAVEETLPPHLEYNEEGATFGTIPSRTRSSRPSLSERTIETLSQLPSSPAIKRRGSNFFESEGVKTPSSRSASNSRPGSSYQSGASLGRSLSRPSSSSGPSDGLAGDFKSSTSTSNTPLKTKLQLRPSLLASVDSRTRSPEKLAGVHKCKLSKHVVLSSFLPQEQLLKPLVVSTTR
jgi:hypothetical protein